MVEEEAEEAEVAEAEEEALDRRYLSSKRGSHVHVQWRLATVEWLCRFVYSSKYPDSPYAWN